MYAKIIDDHVSEQLAAARTDIGLDLVRNLAAMAFVGKETGGLDNLCGNSNGPVYSNEILDRLHVQPEETPFVCKHSSGVDGLFSLVLPFAGLLEDDVLVPESLVPGLSASRVFEALTSEHDPAADYLQLKKIEDPQHPCCGERGVFAKRTIPEGLVFWPYAGVATTNTKLDALQGAFHLHNIYSWDHTKKTAPGENVAFDGLLVRGVLGYVNHYRDVPRARHANVLPVDNVEITTHGGGRLPLVLYVTSEKISIGEELLVDYGERYFSILKPLTEAYNEEKKKYKKKLKVDVMFKKLKISEKRATQKKMEAYRSKATLEAQYQKLQQALREREQALREREQALRELRASKQKVEEQKAQLEALTLTQIRKISHVENKNKQMVKDAKIKKDIETAGGTTRVHQTCECVYGRVWDGNACNIGRGGLRKHWVGGNCKKMKQLLEKYGIDTTSLNTHERLFATDDVKKTPKKGITGDNVYPILICRHNPEHRWSRHSGFTQTMHDATCQYNPDTEAHKRLQDETALKKRKWVERMTALGLDVDKDTKTVMSLYALQAAKQFWDTKATGNIQSNCEDTQERRKLRVSNSLFHDIIAFRKAMENCRRDDGEAREFMLGLFKLKLTIACQLTSEEEQELHESLLDALETWECNYERGAVTDAELLESPFFPLIQFCERKKFLARTRSAAGRTRPRGRANDPRARDSQRRRTHEQGAERSYRGQAFGGHRRGNDRGNGWRGGGNGHWRSDDGPRNYPGGVGGNGYRSHPDGLREFPEGNSDTYEGSYGQSRPGGGGY